MKETDCRICCVCAFKDNLCKEDFCEKYYSEGSAEDFEKLLPHWIPCSERLPKDGERVLATTAWEDVTIAERIYPPINETCWFIHDGNTNATIDDVIAWMPLPESYKER